MHEESESLSAARLMDAAEAVLLAVAEISELTSRYINPVEIMGSEFQPEYLCDFTRDEVVEATAFLHRMGMLPNA